MFPFITIIEFLLAIGWLNLLLLWTAIWASYLISILLIALGQEVLGTFGLVLEAFTFKVARLWRALIFFLQWIGRRIIPFKNMCRFTYGLWITIVFATLVRFLYEEIMGDWEARSVVPSPAIVRNITSIWLQTSLTR